MMQVITARTKSVRLRLLRKNPLRSIASRISISTARAIVTTVSEVSDIRLSQFTAHTVYKNILIKSLVLRLIEADRKH